MITVIHKAEVMKKGAGHTHFRWSHYELSIMALLCGNIGNLGIVIGTLGQLPGHVTWVLRISAKKFKWNPLSP